MKTFQTAVVTWVLGALFGTSVPAFTPSTNGHGVAWVSESAEGWSGDAQTNGSGMIVHLAGAFDQSVDTSNGVGITAYVGLLDPIAPQLDTPTPTLTLTSTETPTETMLTPTLSLTPTVTPTVTLLTLTPTNTCSTADASYDLTGDGEVDARDLIALLASVEDGTNLYDLNCDGITDERDLRAFSAKWKTIP